MSLPEWKKNLFAMWFAQLCGMGAITGVIAFLPLYITELGITDTASIEMWSGLLLAIASFCSALAGPHWGAFADRHGRKLMVARVMFVMAILMMAMSQATNVYQLLVLRMLQGLFGGFTAAALALVTSLTPPEEIGFTMGVFQTAMIAGGALGPLFGGLVADHFGYRLAFIAFGLLCLLSLGIIQLTVTERFVPAPDSKRKQSVLQQIREVIGIPGLAAMLLIPFLIQFAIQAIAPVLPLYVQKLAPDWPYIASTCGTIIAAAGVSSAISSAAMGTLSKRLAPKRLLCIASGCACLTFVAQALAGNVWALGISRGISGLFLGAMLPTVNAIIYHLIPDSKRGVAYGVTSSAALMGNVLGPLSGGLIAFTLGTPMVFWFTACLFAVIAVRMAYMAKAAADTTV